MRTNLTIRFSLILFISVAMSACQYEKTDTSKTTSPTEVTPDSTAAGNANGGNNQNANNDPGAGQDSSFGPDTGAANTSTDAGTNSTNTSSGAVGPVGPVNPTPKTTPVDTPSADTTSPEPVVVVEEPVVVTPKAITLSSIKVTITESYLIPERSSSIHVQAIYDDSSLVDVTKQTTLAISDNTIIDLVNDSTIVALKAGTSSLTATYQGKTSTVNITVQHVDLATLHINGITSKYLELDNANALTASYDASGVLIKNYGGTDPRPGTGFTFNDDQSQLFVFVFDETVAPEAPAYVRFQQNGISTIYTLSNNYSNKIDITQKPENVGGLYIASFDLGLCDSRLVADDCLLPENQLLVNGNFEITRDAGYSEPVPTDPRFPRALLTGSTTIYGSNTNSSLSYYKYATVAGQYQFAISSPDVEMAIYSDASYTSEACKITNGTCAVDATEGHLYVTLKYTGSQNGTSFDVAVTPPTQGTLSAPVALPKIAFSHKGSVSANGTSYYSADINSTLSYQLSLSDGPQDFSLEAFSDSAMTLPLAITCETIGALADPTKRVRYDAAYSGSLCINPPGTATPVGKIFFKVNGNATITDGIFNAKLEILSEGEVNSTFGGWTPNPLMLTSINTGLTGTFVLSIFSPNDPNPIARTASDKHFVNQYAEVTCPAGLTIADNQGTPATINYCFTVGTTQPIYTHTESSDAYLSTQLSWLDNSNLPVPVVAGDLAYDGQIGANRPITAQGNSAGSNNGSYYGLNLEYNQYYLATITNLSENAQLFINDFGATVCSAAGNTETGIQCTFKSNGWATLNLLGSGQGTAFHLDLKKLNSADYITYQIETHALPNSGYSENSQYKPAFTYTTIFNADGSQILARRPVSAENFSSTLVALKQGEKINIRISDAYGGLGHYAVGIRPANTFSPAAINPKSLIPLVDSYEPADNVMNNATVIDQLGVYSYHSFSKDANGYTDEDWFTFTAP